jgi:hypothetical protein
MTKRHNPEEEKRRILAIMDKHAPVFKYDLTRLHLSEDQIEAIYPLIIKFVDKALQEYNAQLRLEAPE